jgi:hypothetical protein
VQSFITKVTTVFPTLLGSQEGKGCLAPTGATRKHTSVSRLFIAVGDTSHGKLGRGSVTVSGAPIGRYGQMPRPVSTTHKVVDIVITFVSEIVSLSLTLESRRT